jgi:hypothetical protein
MRVEPRFVRRTRLRCWFLRLPGLPNRESSPGAPPSTAFTGKVSGDRRARAPGPSEGRVTERVSSESCRSTGCVALVAHADNRSPPRRPRDTPCHRRAHSKGESPLPSVDEPAKTAAPPPPREGQRHPDDQGAFHRSEVAGARWITPQRFLRRSPAHAAHTFSTVCGEVLFWALQALRREGYPRRAFERTSAFVSPLESDAWD